MPEYFGLALIALIFAGLMGIMFVIQLFHDYTNKHKGGDDTT